MDFPPHTFLGAKNSFLTVQLIFSAKVIRFIKLFI